MNKKYDIRGVNYTIRKAKIKDRGLCTSPKSKSPEIKINNKLKDSELLEVLIHEILHACLWDLDETAVDETSVLVTKIILDHFSIEEIKQ
jgi:hypothetical protein